MNPTGHGPGGPGGQSSSDQGGGGWMGLGAWITLWLCQNSELENGPVEIVDLPMTNGDFP